MFWVDMPVTIEEIIKWTKEGMAEQETPFVKWDYLVNRARKKSFESRERAGNKVWEVMFAYVKGKGEKRSEKHKICEAKLGKTWIYWLLEEK